MIRFGTLRHQFVRSVPRELEAGVLYVSMEYATAVHSCCCGCGEQVVTPLTPTDWCMTFDGETVSLHPSVGNWNQKCRSHYIIKKGRVFEAAPWSEKQVEAERTRDQKAKAQYFRKAPDAKRIIPSEPIQVPDRSRHFWLRFFRWLRKKINY